jgi:hypothetical protein
MSTNRPVVHSDPEILGGTTVFVGTRVPLRNLLDYLERGHRPRRISRCISLSLSRASERGHGRSLTCLRVPSPNYRPEMDFLERFAFRPCDCSSLSLMPTISVFYGDSDVLA